MRKVIYFIVLVLLFSCPPANETVPDAPANLTLTSASFCRIVLNWQDNSSNETGFIIERSLNSSFNSPAIINIGANTTSYSDRQNLTANVTYYYRIKAINSAGDSSNSNSANATTLTTPGPIPGSSKIANHTIINGLRLGSISVADIQIAKSSLHIGYGHTSHGSQLADGMSGLVAFANGTGCGGAYASTQNLFEWNRGGANGALDLREGDGYGSGDLDHDCGYYPGWVNETRAYLNNPANYQVNVIIWSWCGQAAGYDEDTMISNYLTPMNQLEIDYPDVTFVYMTCHLDGTGTIGNLNERDNQIRNYCQANNKWLFDFADIESYDPDGITNYMALYASDACDYDSDSDPQHTLDANWATIWQNAHTQNTDWYDCGSAHSQPLNANMKAYAAWWLWCRLAGWDGL